jgi:hypothetical protein
MASFLGNRTDIKVKKRWVEKFNTEVPMLPRVKRLHTPTPTTPEESSSTLTVDVPFEPEESRKMEFSFETDLKFNDGVMCWSGGTSNTHSWGTIW